LLLSLYTCVSCELEGELEETKARLMNREREMTCECDNWQRSIDELQMKLGQTERERDQVVTQKSALTHQVSLHLFPVGW